MRRARLFRHLRLFPLAGLLLPTIAAPAWKEVYDPMVVRSLYLQVDEADWTRVVNDQPEEGQPELQERAQAWFNGEGETPILVEIRRKGATDPVLINGAQTKVSLKIDINALVPGQRWNSLRKLSLEIGGTDGPLNEGFSWQVHRRAAEAGFYNYDAANAAWVKLYVNGQFNGVFTSTEQRDEELLRHRDLYSPANTWLYKVDGSTVLETGIGDSPTFQHLDFAPFQGGGGGGGSGPDLEIDLPQWIDMGSMLALGACNAYIENTDGLFKRDGKNSFAVDFQPPNQKLRMYFPWDLDAGIKQGTENIYGNFFQNEILDEPWYQRVYEHILHELIDGPLSDAALTAFLDDLELVLAPELAADPFISAGSGNFDSLRSWVVARNANVLSQLALPHVPRPLFNHPGGEVVSGFELTMSAPAGQIYYTTDGSDPRLPGGAVSPGATAYSGPILIDRASRVIARALDNSNWSGLSSEISLQLAAFGTPIRVTEIMYNPSDPDPGDAVDNDAYEFFELRNSGAEPFELDGYYLEGISYTFPPGSSIAAGAHVLLVRDAAAFTARYPGVSWDGIYLSSLSNGGEKIRLKNPAGTTVLSVEYDDDPNWVLSPDGMGYSLVNRNADGDPDVAANWSASRDVGGSPGAADPALPYDTDLVFHEVLSHSATPYEDAVELHNPGPDPIDVGGWFLSDTARTPGGPLDPLLLKKYELPGGSVVPAGGYLVLYEDAFGSGNPGVPFGLSEFGGRVYLSSADASGNLTGHLIALEFPASDLNRSYGQLSTSRGPREAVMEAPTFGVSDPATLAEFRTGTGAPNTDPLVGPVVLSEIMYNPLDTDVEFVELHNLSTAPVSIAGWDIDGIDGFEFPAGTNIPAGGFAILVDLAKTTVSDFRSDYGVPAEVSIYGETYDLGNAGESLRLEKPNPVAGQPDILIEKVRFNDKPPWPTEADGAGPSLERLPPGEFGNEPLHWRADTPGGTPGRLGLAIGGLPVARESFWDVYANAAGLDPGWTTPGYNDSAWTGVTGPAGYGEAFINGVVSFGGNPDAKYPTTYFRKEFVVADDPAQIVSLDLGLLYDDGVVLYLNGTEVLRRGLPAGAIAYTTLATGDIEATTYESVDLTAFLPLLTEGTNTLAAEVHQVGPASADLVWDAELGYSLGSDPNDVDGDGLPASWEAANGLDDNDPADALRDDDRDGQFNGGEFLAGTDPQDPNSRLRIDEFVTTPAGGTTLRWSSVAGRTYRVTYSPDLANWFSFGPLGEILANGPMTEFIDPSALPPVRRFYRIGITP